MSTPSEADYPHLSQTADGTLICDLGMLNERGTGHVGAFLIQHVLDSTQPVLLKHDDEIVATLLPGNQLP